MLPGVDTDGAHCFSKALLSVLQVVDAAARRTAGLYRRSHGKTLHHLDSLFSPFFWQLLAPLLSCLPPFSAITSALVFLSL